MPAPHHSDFYRPDALSVNSYSSVKIIKPFSCSEDFKRKWGGIFGTHFS